MKNSGFTLIELSIVLVVIGLIVGGILTGRDLVNSAAQRAQISQIEKYNVAVNTFRNKYGGLPGDLALNLATQFGFTVAGYNGSTGQRDGNGFIDGYCCGGTYNLAYGEEALFWQDLSIANLIDNTFPNSGAPSDPTFNAPLALIPGTAYIGDYWPAAKIGQGNFLYVINGLQAWYNSGGTWYVLGGGQWYSLQTMTSVLANGGMFSNPGVTVSQAYNIDKKIDDGYPTKGNVQAVYYSNWQAYFANPQASDSATSCYNSTSNTYSISINGGAGLNCALSFKFQ